jgi:hydroxymethylglutaryl-CoA reductase
MTLDGSHGLTVDQADYMIENAIGVYNLPLGVARNFLINGREVLVPMAIEEPQ